MTVTVLLFASYAESVGKSSVELQLADGARVEDALAKVRELATGALPPKPLVALNQGYASLSDRLSNGDEVAIIPPVAGG